MTWFTIQYLSTHHHIHVLWTTVVPFNKGLSKPALSSFVKLFGALFHSPGSRKDYPDCFLAKYSDTFLKEQDRRLKTTVEVKIRGPHNPKQCTLWATCAYHMSLPGSVFLVISRNLVLFNLFYHLLHLIARGQWVETEEGIFSGVEEAVVTFGRDHG